MKPVIIFVITFVLLIPISVYAGDELVPQWIKTNAGWWAGGQIDDTTFIDGLEYLISKDILNIDAVQTSKSSEGIPEWVKQTANWWSSNVVTDSEFLNSIKYLIENGIITIEKNPNDFYDIQNWQMYDHSKQSIGNYLEGYVGTITEGDFVYFASFDSSQGRQGEILRYDITKEFESVEAWTTFDAGANGVGDDPDSFSGIISDGKFLYFTPYHNGDEFSGEVLRYDTTKEFESVEAWSTFDPSKNGVGYDASGYWGGTFDGRYVYFSPDWNFDEDEGKSVPHGEVLRYDTTKEFESVEAWSTFDASKNGVGYDPREYLNAVFDGKFIYFAPLSNKDGNSHGEVLRYDTTKEFESVEAWSTFDASKNGVGNDPRGYDGVIFDGKFVYFSPRNHDSGFHGEVLRYDTTKEFESVEAWSTFDPSKNGVGNNPKGFGDGIFDGKFVYFSPFHNGENPHGEVLRYDTTKEFESVEAWSTFDPSKNGVGIFPIGFMDISFDGQFLYFAPRLVGSTSHEILRYDTTKEFESVEAWSTFSPMHDAPFLPVGYGNGVYENDYVYFSQINNGATTGGEVLRYDTTKEFESVEAWSTFDAGNFGIGTDPDGYSGIISDGKFLYFSPFHNGENPHGEVLRYDTTKEFESVEAWSTFDPSKNGVGVSPIGYFNGVFADHYIYFSPFLQFDDAQIYKSQGEVLRYDITKEFESVEAWSTFDAGNFGIGTDPDGYSGIISDGKFLYFSPYHNGEKPHGEVLRYDTTKEFESVEAWSTFDPSKNGVGYDASGYWGGAFDGHYIYFSPLIQFDEDEEKYLPHGEVLRYDTTKEFESVEAWSTFDPSKNGVGYNAKGYAAIAYDGHYIYFSPDTNQVLLSGTSGENSIFQAHGEVLRYDTTKEFESVEAWDTFDPSKNGLGIDAVGYNGVIFDGDSIYLVPFFHQDLIPHGNVLKFQAWQ